MSAAVRVIAAALATAALTWVLGWWAVAAVGFVAALLPARAALGPAAMGLAGALAWAGLLVVHAMHPSFGALLGRVGAVFRIPGVAFLVVALLYAALLGWSANVIGGTLVRRRAPVTNAPAQPSPRYDEQSVLT